jgi:hypothetical protein
VARVLLDGRTGARLARRIAALITARRGASATLPAMAAATAQLTMLRLWLRGEVACPAADLAAHMLACRALLNDPT